MENSGNVARFGQAARCLAPRLSDMVLSLPEDERERITEIRLRSHAPVVLTSRDGSRFLYGSRLSAVYSPSAVRVSPQEIAETFRRICGYSVHSHQSSINAGYITVEGGHRAGVCGTAYCEASKICAVRDISSINLRIAREIKGAANGIFNALFSSGVPGVIIAGAPSSGKTTVLRDLARQLSGEQRGLFRRTAICDERGELAAVCRGIPANDVGINTDVLSSYPKSEAVMIALRSFSPQVIICDEIGSVDELEAIEAGMNSGVSFIVSVHASSRRELTERRQIRDLLKTGAFSFVVLLCADGGEEKIFTAKELCDEICGGASGGGDLRADGAVSCGAKA